MPDFITTIAAPLAEQASPVNDIVEADGWWPSVAISKFRALHRVGTEITDEACRSALRTGMQSALIDLEDWSQSYRFEFFGLDDVPASKIDGQSRLSLCWTRAVMAFAKADLTETRRDYDATGAGERNDAFVDSSIVQLRSDAIHAIRDFKRQPRTAARLI